MPRRGPRFTVRRRMGEASGRRIHGCYRRSALPRKPRSPSLGDPSNSGVSGPGEAMAVALDS